MSHWLHPSDAAAELAGYINDRMHRMTLQEFAMLGRPPRKEARNKEDVGL